MKNLLEQSIHERRIAVDRFKKAIQKIAPNAHDTTALRVVKTMKKPAGKQMVPALTPATL